MSPEIEGLISRLIKHRQVMKNGCWEWTGSKAGGDYGQLMFQSKNYLVHRLMAFLVFNLSLDKSDRRTDLVCHKCDNKACINPAHLEVGTASKNRFDYGTRQLRVHRIKCKKGHESSRYITRYSNGQRYRICLDCQNEASKRHQAANTAISTTNHQTSQQGE